MGTQNKNSTFARVFRSYRDRVFSVVMIERSFVRRLNVTDLSTDRAVSEHFTFEMFFFIPIDL